MYVVKFTFSLHGPRCDDRDEDVVGWTSRIVRDFSSFASSYRDFVEEDRVERVWRGVGFPYCRYEEISAARAG